MNERRLQRFVDRPIRMEENQVLGMRQKNLRISCSGGMVWVTWPNGHERVLKSGQSMTVTSSGKICILALTEAVVRIMKKGTIAQDFSEGLHPVGTGHPVPVVDC